MINIQEAKIEMLDTKIRAQIKGFPKNPKNLYFYGKTGTGKTFTAFAIGNHFKHITNNKVNFYKVNDIIREVRGCGDVIDEVKTINKFVNMPYLIIDDFGVEKLTEFAYNIIYEILDKRIIYNPEKLIITSNLSISDILKDYGDRFASRIMGLCKIIKFDGKDLRLSK